MSGLTLKPRSPQPLDLVHVGGEVEPSDGADPVDQIESGRSAASAGSSWRIEPAAELRGLAKVGSPASARRSLSALKAAIGR